MDTLLRRGFSHNSMPHLFIVGTSHIATQSVNQVTRAIAVHHPSIVAVELDRGRLASLLSDNRQRAPAREIIRQVGVQGFLFSIIGQWVQQKLGAKFGISPGTEMLTAVKLAKKSGARIALIDQDIQVTLRDFSKKVPLSEKALMFFDVFIGFFRRDELLQFDLSKVPEKKVIKKLLARVKERYPHTYEVLVDKRNRVMARRLAHLLHNNPEDVIVAVVGAGHEEDLLALVKKYLNVHTS
ncbi:hypothetical protein GF342_01825 [Candidatus Woesearchaeota archaeon]|nr:hypothetical protein [Candidatus Woesearchaeota archaeon]